MLRAFQQIIKYDKTRVINHYYNDRTSVLSSIKQRQALHMPYDFYYYHFEFLFRVVNCPQALSSLSPLVVLIYVNTPADFNID